MLARCLLASLAVGLMAGTAWGQAFSEDFEGGIPDTWTLEDYLGNSPFQWTTVDYGGRGNNTGGSGLFAIADSDEFPGDYDIGMLTHAFVVPAGATLEYDTDYENFANEDFADVDINVGAGWVNLLSWNDDYPGPNHIVLDISGYAGETAQVRFHYYNPEPDDWDWWWEVDNVTITPEPASLSLLGLGALVLLRRR